MSDTDKGGPAFPINPPLDADGRSATGYPYPDAGMTLRDYFAANAPFTLADAVLAANMETSAVSVETALCRALMDEKKRALAMDVLAKLRNEYADAMLHARKS